ncbi:MAG: hypothetical protein AAGC55_18370 [Myxococcota bacterium]
MKLACRVSTALFLATTLACAGAPAQNDDAGAPTGEDAGAQTLGQQGDPCDSVTDCASIGLSCVDNVCCSDTCEDTCSSCNVPGSEGRCTPVPAGEDPRNECGELDCSEYFWGWQGDSCYTRANIGAAQATCDGFGSCITAEVACAASTDPGPPALTCNNTCAEPNADSCSSASPGVCDPVDLGSETCGTGVCQVVSAICEDGAPNVCVPNDAAAGPELCNNMDDDCDGQVDNSDEFADVREPNNTCAEALVLPAVGSDSYREVTDANLYPISDNDFYLITANETDSSCNHCDGTGDEDFQLALHLSVPEGAGSYTFCTGDNTATCSGSSGGEECLNVPAGSSGTIEINFDGSCTVTDSIDVWVRIFGTSAPAYECLPYTFAYQLVTDSCFPDA